MSSNSEYYDLRSQHSPNTNKWFIAKLFEENLGIPLSSREIDSIYSLQVLEHILNSNGIHTLASSNVADIFRELLTLVRNNPNIKLPGDPQKQRRDFYNTPRLHSLPHKYHGIIQDGKEYTYTPMRISEINDAICDRRSFTREFRDRFMQEKGCKCEMCGNSYEVERLCIDHGRSFDNYGITDEKIAVLLCITCNNIKNNGSAIKIVEHNLDQIEYHFRNFLKIEKRLTENGFPSSEEEKTEVNEIIRDTIIPKLDEIGRDFTNVRQHFFIKYNYNYPY